MKGNDIGYIISNTAFFVLGSFLLWGYFQEKQIGDLGRDGSVPANLVNAVERFRLGYKSELFDNKSLEIQDSEAWRKLNGDLAAYANHLELHQEQRRTMRFILLGGQLLSIGAILYFTVRGRKDKGGNILYHGRGKAKGESAN